jgi:hypothetical protein
LLLGGLRGSGRGPVRVGGRIVQGSGREGLAGTVGHEAGPRAPGKKFGRGLDFYLTSAFGGVYYI